MLLQNCEAHLLNIQQSQIAYWHEQWNGSNILFYRPDKELRQKLRARTL
jgi:hypothetical protein